MSVRDYPPIRILHVVGAMNYGGVETWLVNVLRHIDRSHFKMDFLVHTDEPFAYTSVIHSMGGKIIVCPSPSNPLAYAHNFKQAIKEYGPYNIVHSHLHFYNGFVMRLADQCGIKSRITHSHLETMGNVSLPRRFYSILMKRWISRFATLGLGCSNTAAAELFGALWESDPRWQLLYCGIDLGPFKQSSYPSTLRGELGIPANSPVIGHIGRFEEQKNHAFIILVAERVIAMEPQARFLLIGDGSLRSDMECRVRSLGLEQNFIFAGTRPDIARIMLEGMDVFLFPSLYEGLGLVLIEAQAAGLPCIIADVIPAEADVAKGMIKRLSLKQSATFWAEEVVATLNRGRKETCQSDCLLSIANSEFNIHNSVEKLTKIYKEAAL